MAEGESIEMMAEGERHRLRAYSGKVGDDRRLAAGVTRQVLVVDIW